MSFRKFNHYIYNNIFILPLISLSLLTLLIVNFVLPNSNGSIGYNTEVAYAADAANPNKTTPTASLTVSNSGTQEINVQPNSGTIYSSHKVTIDSVNITNYTLSISGPATLSSVSGKTTITGANGASGSSLPDNTWGYNYNTNGITNESSFASSNYTSFSGSNQTLESADGSPSSIERSLVLAAKFGDTAEPGHYAGKINLSLTAVPKVLTTYTITYNANSGSGAPSNWSDSSYDDSYTTTISSTTPTRSGYTFLGWNTSSTATSANSDYAAGKSLTLQSSGPTLDLYAVWELDGITYTINYNSNGGNTAPAPTTYTDTTELNSYNLSVTDTIPTRNGYGFLGWSDASNSSAVQYKAGDMITLQSATPAKTLYAVWEKNTSWNSLVYMQDMSSNACNSVDIGAEKTLQDLRDNENYTIRKNNDGQCWMTQNLRLKSTNTLDYNNTNIIETYNLPTPLTSDTITTSNFASSDPYKVEVFYNTNIETVGVYYSWAAATAGTGIPVSLEQDRIQATSSVCPKGWYLPSKEQYDNFKTDSGFKNDKTSYTTLTGSTYNFKIAGAVRNGAISTSEFSGIGGGVWTSTLNSTGKLAYFFMLSSFMDDKAYYSIGLGTRNRYYGFPLRCIATP